MFDVCACSLVASFPTWWLGRGPPTSASRDSMKHNYLPSHGRRIRSVSFIVSEGPGGERLSRRAKWPPSRNAILANLPIAPSQGWLVSAVETLMEPGWCSLIVSRARTRADGAGDEHPQQGCATRSFTALQKEWQQAANRGRGDATAEQWDGRPKQEWPRATPDGRSVSCKQRKLHNSPTP